MGQSACHENVSHAAAELFRPFEQRARAITGGRVVAACTTSLERLERARDDEGCVLRRLSL